MQRLKRVQQKSMCTD